MRRTVLANSNLRQIDIQNVLRLVGKLLKGRTLLIDGDLVFLNDKFVGRTQEVAEIFAKEQQKTFASDNRRKHATDKNKASNSH